MSEALFDILRKVTSATITTMLLKKGIRRCWMNSPKPLVPGGSRAVGRAFTLRFIPVREDVATPESWVSPISTRAAVEDMPEGAVVVADAMGVPSAGIFGDILCARMKKREVAALVSDGVVRDVAGVLSTGLPVWCQGTAAPSSVTGLTFVDWQRPVGCGVVAVFPNDVVVADDDGAVVVPAALRCNSAKRRAGNSPGICASQVGACCSRIDGNCSPLGCRHRRVIASSSGSYGSPTPKCCTHCAHVARRGPSAANLVRKTETVVVLPAPASPVMNRTCLVPWLAPVQAFTIS